MARTRAAKPAADEARPAAVGKLFSETRRSGMVESLGSDESAASRAARRARSSRKQACVRAPETSDCSPLSSRESPSEAGYEAEQEAVVSVRRSDCESVTESELLVGRLSLGSRLPQYLRASSRQLHVKQHRGALRLGLPALDNGNVDRRRGAGAIHFVCHFFWVWKGCRAASSSDCGQAGNVFERPQTERSTARYVSSFPLSILAGSTWRDCRQGSALERASAGLICRVHPPR